MYDELRADYLAERLVRLRARGELPSEVPAPLIAVFAFLFILLGTFVGFRSFAGLLLSSWQNFPQFLSSQTGSLAAAAAVVVAGWFLYHARENFRSVYATVEIASAAALAAEASVRLGSHNERLSLLFALLTAMYVAVRGFDNLFKALQRAEVSCRSKDGGSSAHSG